MRIIAALLLGILWQSTPGASVADSSRPKATHVALAKHQSFCLSLMPHRRSPAVPHGRDLAFESALDEEEVSDPDPVEPCAFPTAYRHLTSPGRLHLSIQSQVPTSERSRRLPVLRC